jgi:hypothetical protein
LRLRLAALGAQRRGVQRDQAIAPLEGVPFRTCHERHVTRHLCGQVHDRFREHRTAEDDQTAGALALDGDDLAVGLGLGGGRRRGVILGLDESEEGTA